MAASRPDPYQILGVSSTAPDAEVRAAYRRLVQLHHPDHNAGSAESTRRFEEIQDAYAQVRQRRDGIGSSPRTPPPPPRAAARDAAREARREPRPGSAPPPPDPRLADMEREIREAHLARERARQAARDAAAENATRPSDDELGYVTTDDSLAKILADVRAQASERFTEVKQPVAKRVADLLDELAAKLNGEGGEGGQGPPRRRD